MKLHLGWEVPEFHQTLMAFPRPALKGDVDELWPLIWLVSALEAIFGQKNKEE